MVCIVMLKKHALTRKNKAICPLVVLPRELLQKIVDHFQLEDFTRLNSTSRAIRSCLKPIKVNIPVVINERQMTRWYKMVKEDRMITATNMFKDGVTHLIIAYQDASLPLQISHFFSLVASLRSLKTLEIRQTTFSTKLQHFLSILMKKISFIQLIVQKDTYLEWVAAFDITQSNRKFNIHLVCCPQKMEHPFEEEDSFSDYESLDAEAHKPVTTIPSKRAYDLIVTPPDYQRQRDEMTRTYKKMMFSAMKRPPLKSDNVQFPFPLNRFINPFDVYQEHKQPINIDSNFLYQGHNHTEKLLKPIAEKFMHCILANDAMTSWVLLTELDIFISNRPDLDNCAYSVPPECTTYFSIKLTNEKNNGRGYSELIIQCGDFQVVATGGIYGNVDNVCGGFLGSSVPIAIGSALDTCYTLKQHHQFDMQLRHLRDYKKNGAKIKAGFKSRTFKNHGYQGVHPLTYSSPTENLSSLASRIICYYISGSVTREDLKSSLIIITSSKICNKIPTSKLQNIRSVIALRKVIKDHNIILGAFAQTIINKLDIIEQAFQQPSTTNHIDINLYDLESSPAPNTKLRDLVKCGLYQSIQSQNAKIIEKFMKRYEKTGFVI